MGRKTFDYMAAYQASVDQFGTADSIDLLRGHTQPELYGPAVVEAFHRRVDEEGCGAVVCAINLKGEA